MKHYQMPGLEREQTVTFHGIPREHFQEKINAIDRNLRKKMRENEIRESQSIRFASEFFSVPPLDDE